MSEKVECPDVINALRLAHDEIITLRRVNAELGLRAHAYDTIAQMTRLTMPEQQNGMGIDVAWRLKELVDKLVAERENEKEETQ